MDAKGRAVTMNIQEHFKTSIDLPESPENGIELNQHMQ
jgi:hypothetical protein